eukprot:3146869-Rhodomonas_salina.1
MPCASPRASGSSPSPHPPSLPGPHSSSVRIKHTSAGERCGCGAGRVGVERGGVGGWGGGPPSKSMRLQCEGARGRGRREVKAAGGACAAARSSLHRTRGRPCATSK